MIVLFILVSIVSSSFAGDCDSSEVPTCGENEVYSEKKIVCPPQSCESIYTTYLCANGEPEPGCNCIDGYLRDANNVCIPSEECEIPGGGPIPVDPPKPPKGCKGDPNAEFSKCTGCQKSCDNLHPICPLVCGPPGCLCKSGYVLNKNGKCILPKHCPAKGCKGDPNAEFRDCTGCQGTCDNPNPVCPAVCGPPGCQCKEGYVLYNGKCTLLKQCPAKGCNGDPNAEFRDCTGCQGTCDNPNPICTAVCRPPGCQCKSGYVLNNNGKCIPLKQCPVKGCDGDPNAEFRQCRGCQRTCDNPNPICTKQCRPAGCECKKGYVLYKGKCILLKQCPAKGCKGDPNAEFRDCTSCQGTCDNPNPVCPAVCGPPGCQCKEGYVLYKGKCTLLKQCPAKGCDGDPNAEFKQCRACPRTCDDPNPICIKVCRPAGCICKKGYVLYKGKCILLKQCPAKGCKGDPNAEFRDCTGCQGTCDNPNPVCPAVCGPPGCQCKEGYVLYKGKCTLLKQCPALPQCGDNEVATLNRTICPPQSCEISYTTYLCEPQPVEPGCDCINGYLRNADGVCIPNDDCPPPANGGPIPEEPKPNPPKPPKLCKGDPNAEFRDCTSCQGTCDNPNPICAAVCGPPGCQCKKGYVLHKGKCTLLKRCPSPIQQCGYNEVFTSSKRTCPPETCETLYQPPYPCARPIEPPPAGCRCLDNYLRNSKGICIPKEQCPPPPTEPIKCGYNEVYTKNKITCPPETCKALYVDYSCAPPPRDETKEEPPRPGCKCRNNYLRNSTGICIPKEQCPPFVPTCNGDPNAEFKQCTTLCPQTCENPTITCKAPCQPPGCQCKTGYVLSNGKCIKPEHCPVPTCNGDPNSEFKQCTTLCPQTCENPTITCKAPCQPPGCQCKTGYVLSNGKCIKPEHCPAPKCQIKPRCQQTCAVPTPQHCPAVKPATSNIDGCQCKEGYILSKTGGPCIKIEDCPKQTSCNGDPHAVLKSCPWACPPTCANPEAATCKKKCPPVGCDCEPGYILSTENGKCILPDKCPCGNPCGKNGTFVDCGFRCPNQYCPQDDSGIKIACKPGRPCPPGCGCKDNYKRLNFKDEQCILASDCPPVTCTKPNEVWSSCPSDCLAESCDNVNDPAPVCNKPLECDPRCICKKGFYRNSEGTCVPAKECPKYNPCASACTPTCANPNPPNCDSEPVPSCCESGLVLSEKGGKCIKTENCPKNVGCNGDPNAIVKNCPAPCPSTCDSPNAFPCRKACRLIGCECAPGYLFNKEGKCVQPDQCPGGNPCRKNERFVSCRTPCPTDFCPTSDSRAVVACDPPFPCLSGCVCNLNHKKKSLEDDQCIVSSDCPPVKCTRQNEEWSSCPSACLSEYCEAVDEQPTVCNTLVLNCDPRCICSKNYFRNSSDICISADECRGIAPPDNSCEDKDHYD